LPFHPPLHVSFVRDRRWVVRQLIVRLQRNATHLVESTFSTLSSAHPPANPRATSQWRSLPLGVHATSKPPETITATTANTPVPIDEEVEAMPSVIPSEKKKDRPSQPDWHLFHALQTTRNSLADLDKLARSPPPSQDPNAELKAIEAQVLGATRSASVTARVGESRTPAASSPSVRFGPGTGMGRAPSVSVAASPLTNM